MRLQVALDRELAWFVHDANKGWKHTARARQLLLEKRAMVAKVHGLGRFMNAVKAFDVDGDVIGGELERLADRFGASTGSLKNNIANAHAALDTVDELNAAFGGNGGPPLDVSPAAAAPAPASSVDPSGAANQQANPQ